MTLEEFYDACKNADWFYEMADRHEYYKKGKNEIDDLEAMAAETEMRQVIFNAFRSFKNQCIANVHAELPSLDEIILNAEVA